MFKQILVTTDFSRHSTYALQRAIQFAEASQAELTCIHVVNDHFSLFKNEELSVLSQNQIKEAEVTFSQSLKDIDAKYPVSFRVLKGRTPDKIIQFVENNGIELIFMGAHGTYYLNDYLLGTNAQSVIKQVKTPVQLIKKEPVFPYKRILIPTDFSDSSKNAVETAYKTYPEAEFIVLHIADVWYGKKTESSKYHQELHTEMNHELQSRLERFLQSCEVDHRNFSVKFDGGYPANDIARYASLLDVQLVVAGTRGHSILHDIIVGRVTSRLLRINPTDMLIVPPIV